MKRYTFILNPEAGKGRAANLRSDIESLIRASGLDGSIQLTRHAGHATEIAHAVDSEYICAIGGDGTVNECVNGIIGSSKILCVLPAGSGNDLVKSLGVPRDLTEAFEVICRDSVSSIDAGEVVCAGRSRFFINGVGIGFDAAVAQRTKTISYLSGTLLYVAAVLQTLGKYNAPLFNIEMDELHIESRNLLIAIGNGQCAGGGFYLTPDAKLDDGLLDICLIRDIPIRKVLSIMPKVMKGTHAQSSDVAMHRTTRARISGDKPFFVHADGEIVGVNVDSVEVRTLSKAIRVVAGASRS